MEIDEVKYNTRIDGHAQGFVQGDNASVTININQPPSAPASSTFRGILGVPPPTDSRTIQRRTPLVEAIYATLIQSNLNAVALTGIGGIGKSTLAALLYRYVQVHQETGPFTAPSLWLSIDAPTTFADLVGTLCQALDVPDPPFASLSPIHQAFALCNTLAMAKSPRLVVLDQFENLLDWKTGQALADRPGVGEWLDALNSQPFPSGCRLLLTSRPRPKGTQEYPPTYLHEYLVVGLTSEEGVDLLRTRGVQAAEIDLRQAVDLCNGHALSLTLLTALVQDYDMPLANLLTDPTLWIGDIATNLLDAIFGHLSKVQCDLLRTFSVYRTPVPIEAAQTMLPKTSKGQELSALRALLTQHLIQKAGEGCYQLHTIVASYVRQHFTDRNEHANQQALRVAHAKAAKYYLKLAAIHCPPNKKRPSIKDMQRMVEMIVPRIRQGQKLFKLVQNEVNLWHWPKLRQGIKDVQPLVEAVWQFCQAGQWRKAYKLMQKEDIFADLHRWGENATLLELLPLLLPLEKWHPKLWQAGNIYSELGTVYTDLGKNKEACTYYEKALLVRKKGRVRGGEGTSLNNLGLAYSDLGKKGEAIIYLERALSIHRKERNRREEGTVLNNLGLLYSELGKKEDALRYFEQALHISREIGNRYGEGRSLNNIGATFMALGKQEAVVRFQQALHIFQEVGDRYGEASILQNVGEFYLRQRRYNVALACFLLAKNIFDKLMSPHSDDEQKEIDKLRIEVGEKQFATLLTRVEPHMQSIVERTLSEKPT